MDGGIKGFMSFLNLKVNVITQLRFELVYYEVRIQYVNPDTTVNPDKV